MESYEFKEGGVPIEVPIYLSELIIHSDLHFHFTKKKPNAWWRFWQKVFFGWDWQDV